MCKWNHFRFKQCSKHKSKFLLQKKMNIINLNQCSDWNLLIANQQLVHDCHNLTAIILFNLINNFQDFQSVFLCKNNHKQWQSDFHKFNVAESINFFNFEFNHSVKFLCLIDYIIQIWIWADDIKLNVISYCEFATVLSLIM